MPYRSAIAFLLVMTAAAPAAAQVSVVMHSGIEVEMTARIEPGSVRIPSGVMAMHIGRFHRVVQDRSQRRYFAYDVLVEPKNDSRAFQVRIEPFSLSATDLAQMEVDPAWTYVPLLKYPLVPDVRAGDSVAIDLLENPTTGQKVVDYFVFKRADVTAGAELIGVKIGPPIAQAASAVMAGEGLRSTPLATKAQSLPGIVRRRAWIAGLRPA